MNKPSDSFKKGLGHSIDTIFAPVVVEIMTRTTMMAYVSISLGGLDTAIMSADAALAPDATAALSESELSQFREITLSLEGGEEISFIAKVPEGSTFSELVSPNEELIQAIRSLRDGQTLEVSCTDLRQELVPKTGTVHRPEAPSW